MRLSELAFACYIYGRISDYDKSYGQLLKETRPQLDLTSDSHLMALISWLNKWGCRQFAKKDHKVAANQIREWYSQFRLVFFDADKSLLSLTDQEVKFAGIAYAGLVNRTASYRRSSKVRDRTVVCGPTGTAKILFALRPNALVPWDDPIRLEYDLDGSADSYVTFLGIARKHLQELNDECKERGLAFGNVPTMLGRTESSIAKLFDEYSWVTITRRCPPPGELELRRWVSWLKR